MSSSNTPTPHIGAEKGEIAGTVLLPGDPLRAKYIAEHFLEDVKQFNGTRNMLGYTGIYKGRPVSVMGTGMGCPSIGIYSYELIHFYGCKNLIRVGTAGALMPDVHVRDMVFAMGACTTSNFVRLLGLPGDYSPVCSYSLLERAVAAARERGLSFHVGNVLSSDMFYAPPKQAQGGMTWADMGGPLCQRGGGWCQCPGRADHIGLHGHRGSHLCHGKGNQLYPDDGGCIVPGFLMQW